MQIRDYQKRLQFFSVNFYRKTCGRSCLLICYLVGRIPDLANTETQTRIFDFLKVIFRIQKARFDKNSGKRDWYSWSWMILIFGGINPRGDGCPCHWLKILC